MPTQSQPEPTPTSERPRSRRRLRGVASAAMLIAAVGGAGCGSSSSSTKSTPPAITKAEFVTKANEICGSADPLLSAGAAKLATLHSEAQIATVVRSMYVPSIESQISRIRTLGSPPGDQATVASMLKLVLADLDRLKGNPMLVNTDAFADFAKVAHPYGLTACAPTS